MCFCRFVNAGVKISMQNINEFNVVLKKFSFDS